jgi:hypothetical protein
MKNLVRRLAAAGVVLMVFASGPSARAQSVPPIDRKITYLLPQWFGFLGATDAEVARQVAILRSRIGEGMRVKVGFTTYIFVSMTPVDPADTAAVRTALATPIAQMDTAVALASKAGIPICISFLSAQRSNEDDNQTAEQAADRRTVQWYGDNAMAKGWMSLSRYSRKDAVLREAFIRELGRQLAKRMLQYPENLVAASGDGEVELSSDGVVNGPGGEDKVASRLADYSPFAVAEFRDWLRQGGLYAPGQPFAGEGWTSSSRYAGDTAPGVDSNGDGHTLNGDFGTTFATWSLKHFDWSLSDPVAPDPKAIPVATYSAPGFNALPSANATGFDAPRVRNPNDAYWKLWDLFRQTMVYRHNLAFARWITTSPDPASGATVPADRWFTDQIAADYLFTNVLTLPAYPLGFSQAATFRLDTSASPTWTADVTPYGSLGITSFNASVGPVATYGDVYYRTLAAAAPAIAARGVRWGIFEWNASVPSTSAATLYDQELALVEKYRPSVLAPFAWDGLADSVILDSPFETALRDYVTRRNNVRLTLNKSTVYAQTLVDGTSRTPPQVVRVSGEPGETPVWNASSSSAFLDIVKSADGRSFTVALKQTAYTAGVQSATVVVTPAPGTGYTSTTMTVNVTAKAPAATTPATGSFDTPADLQVVTGELGITGWAIDDVGVKSIDIYRSPLAGEPTQPNGLVYLGSASLVEGARPDIQGSFGTTPLSEKAGWGYMLLTNFLPNLGNGTFTLHVFVTDVDGHVTNLGSRRIVCQNALNVLPFGTIDTPRQGETVSGTIVNFGWALTPAGTCIPSDGSTIDVIIDNVAVGHPVYNNFRPDIATLFPGLCNSNNAIGYFMLDTTTLANGVHTIAWVARNNVGGATGMGSRYFTVANP